MHKTKTFPNYKHLFSEACWGDAVCRLLSELHTSTVPTFFSFYIIESREPLRTVGASSIGSPALSRSCFFGCSPWAYPKEMVCPIFQYGAPTQREEIFQSKSFPRQKKICFFYKKKKKRKNFSSAFAPRRKSNPTGSLLLSRFFLGRRRERNMMWSVTQKFFPRKTRKRRPPPPPLSPTNRVFVVAHRLGLVLTVSRLLANIYKSWYI